MDLALPCLVGLGLALGVSVLARLVRFDRDRASYPVVLIVIATNCALFAVMGGSTRTILLESLGVGGFALVAILGFKRNLWLVAAGLAAHGVFEPRIQSCVRGRSRSRR